MRSCRLNPEKYGLITAYEGARGVGEFCCHSIRPRYFDYAWGEIAGPVLLDFEFGREVRGSEAPSVVFDELVHARYPGSVILFSDGARNPANERVGVGFYVPASGYRFGVRLSDFTSALSAELYAVFCALKYVYRLQPPVAVIFTDSLSHSITHSGSWGFCNEMADCVARSASGLPFVVNCGVPGEYLNLLLERDHQSWCRRLWLFSAPSSSRNRYFDRVYFKTPRPWFSGFRFPRGYLSLVTRLRSSHVCTGSHLICDCPKFSERRLSVGALPGQAP